MKLLVISDTHGRLANAERAIETLKNRIDAVIHLGDMIEDARILEASFQGLAFHYVAGNCDYYYSAEEGLKASKVVCFGETRIFITHGHLEGVKAGYARLAARSKEERAEVALCGHTHEPFNKIVDGVLCVNPGSISFPRGRAKRPSYAVLSIPDQDTESPSAGIVELAGR